MGGMGRPTSSRSIPSSITIKGASIDKTEGVFRLVVALLILVVSFSSSIIAFNGGGAGTLVYADTVTSPVSLRIPASEYAIQFQPGAVMLGVIVQLLCTYIQWLHRKRKYTWWYRGALAADVGPSFYTSWSIFGDKLWSIFALLPWWITGIVGLLCCIPIVATDTRNKRTWIIGVITCLIIFLASAIIPTVGALIVAVGLLFIPNIFASVAPEGFLVEG
jgi:hypothetical protein